MAQTIDRALVASIGGQVLAAQLAVMRDPSAVDPAHLDGMADLAVRAAMALDAAVPRAEKRLADEQKAAEDAEAAEKQAEADAKAAQEAAAAQAASDAAKAAAPAPAVA